MLAVSTPTDERPLQGWNPAVLDNQRNPYVINPYALSDERAEDTSKFHNAPSALPGKNDIDRSERHDLKSRLWLFILLFFFPLF